MCLYSKIVHFTIEDLTIVLIWSTQSYGFTLFSSYFTPSWCWLRIILPGGEVCENIFFEVAVVAFTGMQWLSLSISTRFMSRNACLCFCLYALQKPTSMIFWASNLRKLGCSLDLSPSKQHFSTKVSIVVLKMISGIICEHLIPVILWPTCTLV